MSTTGAPVQRGEDGGGVGVGEGVWGVFTIAWRFWVSSGCLYDGILHPTKQGLRWRWRAKVGLRIDAVLYIE